MEFFAVTQTAVRYYAAPVLLVYILVVFFIPKKLNFIMKISVAILFPAFVILSIYILAKDYKVSESINSLGGFIVVGLLFALFYLQDAKKKAKKK